MMYFKKIMKVLVVALVVCVLLFSVVNANAMTWPPIYTFAPIPSMVATIPPTIFTFFSVFPFFTPEPLDTSPVVSFDDEHLRDALMSELGVAPDELTEDYLGSLAGTLDLSGRNIEELGGIEYLTDIDYLILRDNPIYSRHEIKKLVALTGLEYLDLSALSITELPSELGNMTNLEYLDISANRIDSLPSSFTNLNLNVLLCNYCFFDIADPNFINVLISSTNTADYQYQLAKLDFYVICETPGTAIAKWDEMPDIIFPNGAKAELKRYSISTPNSSGGQGAWLDSESRSTTSYTFEGLDPTKTYSFDISADYYIKNTIYDGKYIKFYSKELFQPIPQDTPTPTPTSTPVPTATPVVTDAPTATLPPESAATQAPVDMITIAPSQAATNNQPVNNDSNSMMTLLLVLVIVLIVAIIGLVIVLFIRMNKMGGLNNQTPPRK